MTQNSSSPIGIFDSGVGGLTVMKSITSLLPKESITYFADTAHVPYGNKTAEQIAQFSHKSLSFLVEKKVKLLIVACHTSCTTSFSFLKNAFETPIFGITDAAFSCIAALQNKRHIAILGTQATIHSEAYQKKLHGLYPTLTVTALACPLFVPLIEKEFLYKHPLLTMQTVKDHLKPLLRAAEKNPLDAVVLACTHYPLLQDLIRQEIGPSVSIIDPSSMCAKLVQNFLQEENLHKRAPTDPHYAFYVSGCPKKFQSVGSCFSSSILPSAIYSEDASLKEKA